MSVFVAAKTLGDMSGWRLTNLEFHKVLYAAHMLHLGRTGQPLFGEVFQAWEMGPVVPRLYGRNKQHGRGRIPSFDGTAFTAESTHFFALNDAYLLTKHLTPSQMITYTHRHGGAWEKHCHPGGDSNEIIPNSDILEEFRLHMWPSDDAVAWAEEVAEDIANAPNRYLSDQDERAFGARIQQARLN